MARLFCKAHCDLRPSSIHEGMFCSIRGTDCEFSESACHERTALAAFSQAEGNVRSVFGINRKGAYEPLASPFGKLELCAAIPPIASPGKARLATDPAKAKHKHGQSGKAAKHGILPRAQTRTHDATPPNRPDTLGT